ncbi:hypothetical protein [Cellulomonas sp. URHD0024]|uniref:hypothetical protein n=1 Tax=Cellulomonas sp. URHD0024 TaxID=1302620 RepID=UPI00040332EF|nr:hypothetical protein [Cellulomonas sp. URHD0024]
MSGSTSLPADPEGADPSRVPPPARGWWWLVGALAAFALLILLVAEPWSVQTEPTPTEPALSSPSATLPQPSATPSVSVAPPGSTEIFDATTSLGLFVTAADLVEDVPAAKPGVDELVTSGQVPWGLPAGTVVEPASCVLAVTVVGSPPSFFDVRGWGNPGMDFRQSVTVLPDPAAAQEAFRELVTTIDACPTYREIADGVDGAHWAAQPAIEGQGVYPSVVLRIDRTVDGTTVPGYQGRMLVGNTIVSWTAQALSAETPQAALATLGDPASLSAMVQGRAQLAVRALG